MARRPLIARGSILAPKEEVAAPTPPDDMTERVVQRNRARSGREAPPENDTKASIYPHIQIDEYVDKPIDEYSNVRISEYAPAKKPVFSSVGELEHCALPTSSDAARAFLTAADAEALGRAPVYLKVPMGLDVLLVRLLGGYRAKKYKQDFIIRGIKLVLYEMYTGRALVEFGDGTDPKPEKRSNGDDAKQGA